MSEGAGSDDDGSGSAGSFLPPGAGVAPAEPGSETPGGAGAGRYRSWRARHKAKLARRSRWRVWGTRGAITVVVLIVAVVAATAGYTSYRLGQIHTFHSDTVKPVVGPSENILLIGSTSRCAASSIAQFRYQCVDQNVNGVNSDVVLIAHLDGVDHSVSLLSIPRDSFVPGARSGSSLCGGTWSHTPGLCADKIDSALVEGPDQLSRAIEQDFGIPINHIIDLNFATFEDVVNALGGLWMYFPNRLIDASSGLDVHHVGCIHINGSEALELVRARHMYWFTNSETPNVAAIDAANTPSGPWYTPDSGGQYDGSGDLGRIVRVHLFLKALAQQVQARGLSNPVSDNALIGAIAPNLTTDSGLSGLTLAKLAFDYRHANVGTAPELTLPTITDAATYYYEGANYGDVIFPSEPQDQQAIDKFLGTTPPGWKLAPSSVSVSVIDGTSSASQTSSTASQLGALGYRMVPTAVSRYVGPEAETTVLYNGPAHLEQAEKVMSSLSGAVVLGQGVPAGGADVSVVTGSIFSVVKPAVASPGAGSRGSAGGTTGATSPPSTAAPTTLPATSTSTLPPVPTTTNPNIGAPTAATPGVPSYDPRSCPKIPS